MVKLRLPIIKKMRHSNKKIIDKFSWAIKKKWTKDVFIPQVSCNSQLDLQIKKTFSIEPPFLLHHLVNPFLKIAALKIISSI
jgi:hypothetical protein